MKLVRLRGLVLNMDQVTHVKRLETTQKSHQAVDVSFSFGEKGTAHLTLTGEDATALWSWLEKHAEDLLKD